MAWNVPPTCINSLTIELESMVVQSCILLTLGQTDREKGWQGGVLIHGPAYLQPRQCFHLPKFRLETNAVSQPVKRQEGKPCVSDSIVTVFKTTIYSFSQKPANIAL